MADVRKKLSGSQNRKRKSEKDKIKEELAGSLKKFIISTKFANEQPSTSLQVGEQLVSNKEIHLQNPLLVQQPENIQSNAVARYIPGPPTPVSLQVDSMNITAEGKVIFNKDTHLANLQIVQQQENFEPQVDALDFPNPATSTEAAAENAGLIVLKDPALWPKILTDKIRMYIFEIGPLQLKNIQFPLDDSNRSFSTTYYDKKLSNNEKVPRTWLIYSK